MPLFSLDFTLSSPIRDEKTIKPVVAMAALQRCRRAQSLRYLAGSWTAVKGWILMWRKAGKLLQQLTVNSAGTLWWPQ